MSIAVTVTNSGLNKIRDLINANLITYIALSTDTTAPSASDTTLTGEVYRMAVSAGSAGVSTGEGLINAVISSLQASGVVIQKVGWFGGSATSVLGSGTLIAEALYNHTHSNESLQLLLDYTI